MSGITPFPSPFITPYHQTHAGTLLASTVKCLASQLPKPPRKDTYAPRNLQNTPTRAQTFLTTSTTTIPSPALIHNSTGLQTVAGATIMTNREMRQA